MTVNSAGPVTQAWALTPKSQAGHLGHMRLHAPKSKSVTEMRFVLKQTHLSVLRGVFLLEFNCFNITACNRNF